MNVAIETRGGQVRRPSARKTVLAWSGGLVLGLAVIIGAFVLTKDTASTDGQLTMQQARLQAILAQPPVEEPDIVFYIVGSEAQRDLVEGRLNEAGWIAIEGNFTPSSIRRVVLMASDPAQEAEVSRTIGDASTADASAGNKVEVYDLRNK